MNCVRKKLAFMTVLIVVTSNSLYAAGYELLEQSGKGVGTAFAGSSTGFGDGSESFFNPAALTQLSSDSTASANIHFIVPHAEFSDDGSSIKALGMPLSGNQGGDGGEFAVVPNVYYARKLNDSVSFGLGINSPFGLTTEYNETWVGRYQAIKSELTTININPAVGVKVNEMFSFGASLQTYYADATLSNAVDFGTIGASTLGALAPKLGLLPQQADGFATVDGDDWGVGYGLGALFTPDNDWKIGVNYRSKVDFTLKGDGTFDVPTNAVPLTQTGLFVDQGATADMTLPESINFGAAYKANDCWTLMGDATWIKWDRFKELRVKFDGAQPDSVQDENWENTWRYSLGQSYAYDSNWTIRAGFTVDETPIQGVGFRTPRIPDATRYWASVGASYQLNKDSELSLDFAHIFVPGASTEITNSTGATLKGDWELGVDVLSLRYNYLF